MSSADAAPRWTRALVVGLGKSGLAAARLLHALGVEVRGYDQRPDDGSRPAWLHGFAGAEIPVEALSGIDLLVLSPGVPPRPVLARRQEHAPQAEVHGELGLALSLVHGDDPRWPATRTTLITGTNGKSTVTALTGHLLAAAGRRPFVGGNLGEPLCDRLAAALEDDDAPFPDDLVLECSSYQLETLPQVPTEVAMLLNVTPDHLDRYDSMEHYARTKARVFDGLQGLALLSDGDAWLEATRPAQGRTRLVGDGDVTAQSLRLDDEESVPRSALGLAGHHNATNAVFALLAARHLGVALEVCQDALGSFEGLPHRMVFVRELDGVAFYNDSKATNVASTLASLGGFPRPFVLVAGGRAKGDDLSPLRALLAERGRGLVAIGESAQSFVAIGENTVPTTQAGGLEEAVRLAREMASPGEAVVLCPACASFDMFRSYAQRGDVFTQAVLALR